MGKYFDRFNHDLRKINNGIRTYSDLLIEQSLQVWNIKSRVGMYFLSLVLSLVATYFISPSDFSQAQKYTLFILFFSICLWVTEAIPPFAVGILIVGFLVYTMGNAEGATLSPAEFSNTWSDSVIWIFLGGFFLSEGMRKTFLDIALFRATINVFSSKPNYLILGIIMVTSILSLIISNTATAAMVLAAVTPFLKKEDKDSPMRKAILLSIPVAATFAGMASMISSPPNLIVVEVLKSKGYIVSVLDWFILGFPVALVLLLGFWLIICKKYTSKVKEVNLDFLKKNNLPPIPKEIKFQRLIVVVTLSVTVFLWLVGHRLQIPTAFVAAIPITFLPMLGVITAEDIRKLPWDTLMLVAGGLALGIAIKEFLAPYYSVHLKSINLYIIPTMIIFALITVLCSNVMSSTATATIVVNIAAVALQPEAFLPTALVIGLCSSCGLFLPVSGPPNAIVYSTGMIKQKDFFLGGTYGVVAGTLTIMIWVFILMYFTGFFESIANT